MIRPTVAGKVRYPIACEAEVRVARSSSRSPRAACAEKVGRSTVATAWASTPWGKSISEKPILSAETTPVVTVFESPKGDRVIRVECPLDKELSTVLEKIGRKWPVKD